MQFGPEIFAPKTNIVSHELLASQSAALELATKRLAQPELAAIWREIQTLRVTGAALSIADGAVVAAGEYLEPQAIPLTQNLAERLSPWRKGPFQLPRLFIDAEWRSDRKWERLLPALPRLAGKRIADVGCNNGYTLLRLANAGAESVVGFDPTIKYWLQYQLIAAHLPTLPVAFLPLGWQALNGTLREFDIIFCMGLNYHVSDPLELFLTCHRALKPGGLLVCESIIVDAACELEIFPEGKYWGVGGVYAIPTVTALTTQLESAGFTAVREQHRVRMTATEQRSTLFSPQKSFADFIADDGRSTESRRKNATYGNVGLGAAMSFSYPPLCRAAVFATK
ncbi:MAG: tRNA 5-methoxyuridine(34)/uridine 5-oxyacetic acid(34) synthase CmoB [Spirochaetes bacterium]|nr:tRNA 5-methoxyuridine(34)/uridine 5-oxyacetic acid(34) synthase CmoB [Spirochaetota bacterium]